MRPLRWLPAAFALACADPAGAQGHQPLLGFYAPWDPASLTSAVAHRDRIEILVPAWLFVNGPSHAFRVEPDPEGRAALAAPGPHPATWLMLQNAHAGRWDGAGAAALLADPAASRALLARIEAELAREQAGGLVVDLEALPARSQSDLLPFLALARERLTPHGWTLAVTAPAGDADWDLHRLATVVDRIILMAYDEHWQSGPAGPIASDHWFAAAVADATAKVGAARLIVAIASYAYDWPAHGTAGILTVEEATRLAAAHGVRVQRDPVSGAGHFSYRAGGEAHQVWIADALSVQRQLRIARAAGAAGVGLWRLGTEDPGLWALPELGR